MTLSAVSVALLLVPLVWANNCSDWRLHASQTANSVMGRAWYDVNQGPWNNYWWKSANTMETITDFMDYTNTNQFGWIYDHVYQRGGSFINTYYDDEGWWGIAWLKAYERTKDGRFLKLAQSIHRDISGGWDDHCGGGVWWSKDRNYKNAIPNELFLVLSTRLYRVTGDESYLNWADKEWNWFAKSGMINSQGLVNDGLTNDCKNNGENTWTYNQGVILGGLQELYVITKNPAYLTAAQNIAGAAMNILRWPNGVLKESCDSNDSCGSDGAEFKGVFVRYLGQLASSATPDERAKIQSFLSLNADALWNDDRGNGVNFGGSWAGPFSWDGDAQINLPRTQVALDAFNAAFHSQC